MAELQQLFHSVEAKQHKRPDMNKDLRLGFASDDFAGTKWKNLTGTARWSDGTEMVTLVVRNVCLHTPNSWGFLVPKRSKTAKFFNQLNVFPMSPVFVTTPFLVQKALKTANSEKFVFSCQTSKVVPKPPSSLVFRRKPAPRVCRAPNSVFCPEKPANSRRLNSSLLVTALSPLAFWVPVPELLLRRVFRGPTARRGPGPESDSPPRWSVSPLHPAPFFGAKSAPNGQVRRVRFSCRTASGMPKPPNSQVFGERAPDNHFAQFSAFGPEKRRIPARRACHRLSPLCHRSLWGRKVRKRLGKAKPAPRLRTWVWKTWLILPVFIRLSQSRS